MSMDFHERVAIVTGAGRGLGRSHALALATRGARVVVNDLAHADEVAGEISAAGGTAIANKADVVDYSQVEAMVDRAMTAWGRVDILVNNAGILRDKSFQNMSLDDFRMVVDVHLMGSVHCTKAVWNIMRSQSYGRIVFTTSSTGLYGNFGQANYGAAKMALVGLMNTLHLEGAKYDIRVNCLAPAAGTAMTEGLLTGAAYTALSPEAVSPGMLFLAGPDAPSRAVLAAGGGVFAVYRGLETLGIFLQPEQLSAEAIAARWDEICEPDGMLEFGAGFEQAARFAKAAGVSDGSADPGKPG